MAISAKPEFRLAALTINFNWEAGIHGTTMKMRELSRVRQILITETVLALNQNSGQRGKASLASIG